MKPTDPPPPGKRPAHSAGDPHRAPGASRPAGGGGPTYRHPVEGPEFGQSHDDFHRQGAMGPRGGHRDNPEVGHEHSDVNVRAILMSAVVIVVVTVISHIVTVLVFGWLERSAAASDAPASPLARPATQMPNTTIESPVFNASTSPGPQLLTNEPMALERHRADERRRLHGYGWVNEGAGVAHIPVEQAKKLIAERGLPVREAGPVDPALGTRRPVMGESSGGRAITVPLPEPAAAPAAEPAAKPHGGH